MVELNPYIRRILGGEELVAVDVGARGDIPSPWLPLDGLATFVGFEPDREACEALREKYAARGNGDRYRIVEAALGRANEKRTLHVPPSKEISSFYGFDYPLKHAYFGADTYTPVKEVVVRTRHAGEAFREIGNNGPDLAKLDIQGAELEVLEALHKETVESLLAVQVEASMQHRPNGQPHFSEIDAFMTHSAFELFDIRPIRVRRTLDGRQTNYMVRIFDVYPGSASVSARIWEIDALYFKPAEHVVDTGDAGQLRKLAVCFALYGFFAEALHVMFVGEKAGVVATEAATRLRQTIIEWHRLSRRKWRYRRGRGQRFARRLVRLFDLGENPRWWPYDNS